MSDRDDFGSFISGFFFGGLIGAVVALLMAPQSGEETRTMIKEKGIELKDKTSASLEEAYAYAEKAAADARVKAEELTNVAKQRAEELKKQGQVVLEEQKARLKNVVDAAKVSPSPSKEVPKEEKADSSKKPSGKAG